MSGTLRAQSTSFANGRGAKACGGTTRWAHAWASITAPLLRRAHGARPPGWLGCTGPPAEVLARSSSSDYVGARRLSR